MHARLVLVQRQREMIRAAAFVLLPTSLVHLGQPLVGLRIPSPPLAVTVPPALDPEITELVSVLQAQMTEHMERKPHEPFVTLTYAQALDGSIAGPSGASGPRLILSGDRAMTMTHALRAAHDAILVGIGTVIADDPKLTVRLVSGPSPLRVILDSRLRLPADAQLLQQPSNCVQSSAAGRPHTIIVTLEAATSGLQAQRRVHALRDAGVDVLAVATDAHGRPCLRSVLTQLRTCYGVRSIMIEGGATIIASCISAMAAHRVVVTLAPRTLVNGLRPGTTLAGGMPCTATSTALRRVDAFCLDDDVIISGEGPAVSE